MAAPPDTIAGLWESFEAGVLHPESGPDRRRELRRAFYGGFHGMLCLACAFGSPEISSYQAAELLYRLMMESQLFKNDVLEGRA